MLVDNIFAGAPAQIIRGPGEPLGYIPAARIAFADERAADFRLGPESFAIDAAVDPPKVADWGLLPAYEYLHPAGVRPRPVIYLRDLGALEFCGW